MNGCQIYLDGKAVTRVANQTDAFRWGRVNSVTWSSGDQKRMYFTSK